MRYKRQIVTFLLGAAFLMFNTAHAAVIVNHMMTKDPKSNTSCETPVATPPHFIVMKRPTAGSQSITQYLPTGLSSCGTARIQ